MKIYDPATITCTTAFIIDITVAACYKSMSSLDEQSLLSSISLLSCSPPPPLLPSGFMCITMLSMTYGTTLSLSKYSFWIFSTRFQYLCWSSFVTSHTRSLVTCSNYWGCIPAVKFSCVNLFNWGSVSSIGLCYTYGGSQTAWPWLASMRSIVLISLL